MFGISFAILFFLLRRWPNVAAFIIFDILEKEIQQQQQQRQLLLWSSRDRNWREAFSTYSLLATSSDIKASYFYYFCLNEFSHSVNN